MLVVCGSALHLACLKGHADVAGLLLRHMPVLSVLDRDSRGMTPLVRSTHYAWCYMTHILLLLHLI